MTARGPGLNTQAGFTLIELVVAVAFLGIVIVAISNLFIGLRQVNRSANGYTIAVEAAQQEMETLRNTAYSGVTVGTTDITTSLLSAYPALLSPRSATLTVAYINTDGSSAAVDTGLKKVDVAVSYTDRTGTKNVQFRTWMANKGINP
jgi:prepilin-type N-terminal cleavage/methylation domain-containing protein